MNIKINAVDFSTDKKLEEFINEKLNKLWSMYDGIIGAEVILKLENTSNDENKIVEVLLIIKGSDLFSKKQAKTFEEGIVQCVDALKVQLKKYKDKIRNK
ncbi:MAG: hypothetical protein A2X12_04770 [Bacteroidetes bacterium GWE2_29_8]|nr:MAG: hypothetical protein A2X12_04770 [Bacteroidetes bacterium GWE2_29_8]